MADFVECTTYQEINLDENPVVVPRCGHVITVSSLDGHMAMSKFYRMSDDGNIHGVISSLEPFSVEDLKACPICRYPLRNIHRYNRIVKRGLIGEATKRFIVWANASFIPLEEQLNTQEVALSTTKASLGRSSSQSLESDDPNIIELSQSRATQIRKFSELAGLRPRYAEALIVRSHVQRFLRKVKEAEQPYGKVYRMVQDVRRATGEVVDFAAEGNILRVRERLLASALLLRCDLMLLSDFVKAYHDLSGQNSSRYRWPKGKLTMNLTQNRKDCQDLAADAALQGQPMQEIEARVYFARFVTLERAAADASTTKVQKLVELAREQLQTAKTLCSRSPNTKTMLKEVEAVEKELRESTFYTAITNDEKRAVYAAMKADFGGTGHWYYCREGHLFTVGECGMPMQTSVCPQCGAPVGGSHHQAVEGVRPARDMDEQFGRLGI
ncbi:hypothetical protein MMC17_002602 [Xylographa soralifera]|nr:hypothetical protein [Xylographa soralifera]